MQLGKFHLHWKRKSSDVVNEAVFELQSFKVNRTFLALSCSLPPYGILRTPAEACYYLENRTSLMQEYSLTMEPSDAFMFSGPRQLRVKVFPRDRSTVRYVFYPLITGNLHLPKLKILPLTSGGVASLDKCGVVEDIITRSFPLCFKVLPLDKMVERNQMELDHFELKRPAVIDNLPFTVCVKNAVKS